MQHRFSDTEHRFLGIYKGLKSYLSFIIYFRGGYKYSIISNGQVLLHTSSYTTTGDSAYASTFPIRTAHDASADTTNNIRQVLDLTQASGHYVGP